METKRLWVIEYSVLCMKHIKDSNLGSGMIADRLDRLCHNARRLHTHFENACNRDITARENKIYDNIIKENDTILSEIFPARNVDTVETKVWFTPYIEYCPDPRGAPISIYLEGPTRIIVPY